AEWYSAVGYYGSGPQFFTVCLSLHIAPSKQAEPALECGDMSPLSDWQTCLPVQNAFKEILLEQFRECD
ncbi:MAG TPA: hypothetical protein VN761_08595, partial [Candidatus Polarisedimenticolia bacterium]|nr:hypothetical protein [Candidatus Polarisedimenticolia bacterium]